MTAYELRNALRVCASSTDKELRHVLAEDLLLDLLLALAQGHADEAFIREAVQLFRSMEKWYS